MITEFHQPTSAQPQCCAKFAVRSLTLTYSEPKRSF